MQLTEIDNARNLVELFLARADAKGDAPFLGRKEGSEWVTQSWREVAEQVCLLAENLRALGLKHGHDASGYGALHAEIDGMASSVMTYRSYFGAQDDYYQNASDSYAQTYMPYDVAALQSLYGINWETNAGRTVYSWDAVTGEMAINGTGQGTPAGPEVFATIWDGGGRDLGRCVCSRGFRARRCGW